jgi:hypothetical protein
LQGGFDERGCRDSELAPEKRGLRLCKSGTPNLFIRWRHPQVVPEDFAEGLSR